MELEKRNQELYQKLEETQEHNIQEFMKVIKEYMRIQGEGYKNANDGFDIKFYNMKRIEAAFRENGVQGLLDGWMIFGQFPEWFNEMMYDKRT